MFIRVDQSIARRLDRSKTSSFSNPISAFAIAHAFFVSANAANKLWKRAQTHTRRRVLLQRSRRRDAVERTRGYASLREDRVRRGAPRRGPPWRAPSWPPHRSHDVGHPTREPRAHRNGARESARTSTARVHTRGTSRVSSLPRSIARRRRCARASSYPARARFSGHPRHHMRSTTSRAASRHRPTRARREGCERWTRACLASWFRERGARRDRCARDARRRRGRAERRTGKVARVGGCGRASARASGGARARGGHGGRCARARGRGAVRGGE